MPITYERDDERRRITVTVVGPVSLEEFFGIVDRQAAEGTWRHGLLYHADGLASPEASDVRKMVAHVDRLTAQYGSRGPVAIVSKRVEIYGTARMYSTLSEQQQVVTVFRTTADAENWLAERVTDGAQPS